MMTAQTYKLDFSGGGGSPFQVFDGSGNVMFDARYASLRTYLSGSAVLGANGLDARSGTNAYTTVTFATGHFANAPFFYALEEAYLLAWPETSYFGSFPYGLYAPWMLLDGYTAYPPTVLGSGIIAVSGATTISIGNMDAFQGVTIHYNVFENTVDL